MLEKLKNIALPDLDYDYGDLEPHIIGSIMELHHKKHHQAYINGFLGALSKIDSGSIFDIVSVQDLLLFHGGGHINHSIFWKNLSPINKFGGILPKSGILFEQIELQFGSTQLLIEKMSKECMNVLGSGWAWLVWNPSNKSLEILHTMNQTPVVTLKKIPLLGIDVWEHSYYLQFKNIRAEYVKSIWNVINWKDIERRYEEAISVSSN